MPLDFYDNLLEKRLAALRTDFFPRLPSAGGKPLTIELGCGHGHYLTAYAAARPAEYCVGLDLLADRIARAERKAVRAKLTNLAFVQAEATLFLSALAALPERAPVRRVFVLFSDPWPKRRHWKHRVMQTELLDVLAGMTEAGATVHFRTDHPDYFAYAREVVAAHGEWRLANADEVPWPFEHASVFEERALAGVPRSLTALRR